MSLFTVIPQGPFESNGRKQLSLSSRGWVLIRSGQFKITLVAELGIQHIVTYGLDRDVGHRVQQILNCNYCFSSFTYGGDLSLSVVMALASLRFQRNAQDYEESRQGMTVFAGDAASFHEWQFRLQIKKSLCTAEELPALTAKVVDALRGEALSCAMEIGLAKLIDGGNWP